MIRSRQTIVFRLPIGEFSRHLTKISRAEKYKAIEISGRTYLFMGAYENQQRTDCTVIFIERHKGDPCVIGSPTNRFAGVVLDMKMIELAAAITARNVIGDPVQMADEVLFRDWRPVCS
jgi:hypothetical protein